MTPRESESNAPGWRSDAGAVADVALALINQHMTDCGERYAELNREIARRFEAMERDREIRHSENVRRLDSLNRLLFAVAATLIIGLSGLTMTLIHNGGHL